MIIDRFGRDIAPGCYWELFEDIPLGEENAIYQYELAKLLNYKYGISPLAELKRVITDMLCDGYVIMRTGMKNRGKYYRFKNIQEIERHLGPSGAKSLLDDLFLKI